ncbi:hypothetical protein [Inhella proteolytica]|uniref:Uncharacterized protein n=1 Tax=Inhella proteolytica TaxID=2795029 RepID=A0A931J516_9BURK|nr:hypothetical protein [Inhella proteolytica]MBH9579744.1 hypothetical protein [Inhella proteolytica]
MRALYLSLLMAALANFAQAEGLSCFDPQDDAKPANDVQKKVLEQSKKRAANLCGQASAQCQLRLLEADRGELHVTVDMAFVDKGRCLVPIDARRTEVYSINGRFLYRMPL